MSLPRFVVLKSNYNNKYLPYIQEDVQVHGFLQFSGVEVVSLYAKFEVEMAKSGHGLVHIRCCYNNKYWLGHYACLWRIGAPFDSCLFAGSKNPDKDSCDDFTIIDWESLLIMPKHVAFKGDNGQYLSAHWIEGHQYIQFASNDVGDPTVGNKIFTTYDGSIRVKSDYFSKFWRRSPNWIWADLDDTTNNNSDTLFWPIKVDNNVVAFRNLGNNNFCMRLTIEGKTSCLNVGVSTISKEA
ncbi:hypothetical protein K1719_044713 [Acacia pycnantha]|nr:hypothetical protein K1719_044713 [Acacia pycnantha]